QKSWNAMLSFTCLVFFTFNTVLQLLWSLLGMETEPPSFKRELLSLEAVRGSVAVLECEITGSAPLEVSWKKNKKRLTGDKKHRIVSQGALASLEIQSFESADAGEYECTVSNEVGSVTSNLHVIIVNHLVAISCMTTVISEPPMFSKRIESTTAVLGNAVKSAFVGSAPMIIKWFREDKEIFTGGKCFIKKDASSSSLELHSVKPSDSAKYTCQVSNDAGKVDCTVVLFVKGAAFILHFTEVLQCFLFVLPVSTVIVPVNLQKHQHLQ
uniref:Ig-like domain-containing protein n=1 Tax=Salarias fasciatus TaxID=181472 RepID=A0A672IAT0_SALFA